MDTDNKFWVKDIVKCTLVVKKLAEGSKPGMIVVTLEGVPSVMLNQGQNFFWSIEIDEQTASELRIGTAVQLKVTQSGRG